MASSLSARAEALSPAMALRGAPLPAEARRPSMAVTLPPLIIMDTDWPPPRPLSLPMPGLAAPPLAVSEPSGWLLGPVWSMEREVPSPREMPAQPAPL